MNEHDTAPPISLDKFLEDSGLSPVTAWRWRKKGWLKTINIAGRNYITAASMAEFNRRAAAGEFSKKGHVPTRRK